MSVGRGKVLVHTGETKMYTNGKAFIGDEICVFFADRSRQFGVLDDIRGDHIVLSGKPIKLSHIEAFNIIMRGENYPRS